MTFGPYGNELRERSNESCDSEPIYQPFSTSVTTHGQLADGENYARTKIGELGRFTHQPVLHTHVKLGEHADPAVARRVIEQANFDVNGRLVRAQVEVEATTAGGNRSTRGAPASSTGTQRRTLGSQARRHPLGWSARMVPPVRAQPPAEVPPQARKANAESCVTSRTA